MQKHIFLIGPGAVGKTTYSKLLAKKLKIKAIDLDDEFIKEIGHIRKYCHKYGYEKYHALNSKLFYKLLAENRKTRCIFAISPGALMRGITKIKNKNIDKINKNGISILLMPSKNFKDSVKIIFNREQKRHWYKDQNALLKKIKSDVKNYRVLGDIKIYTEYNTIGKNIDQIIKQLN